MNKGWLFDVIIILLVLVCLYTGYIFYTGVHLSYIFLICVFLCSFVLFLFFLFLYNRFLRSEVFEESFGKIVLSFPCSCEYNGGHYADGELNLCEHGVFYLTSDNLMCFRFLFSRGDMECDLDNDCLTVKVFNKYTTFYCFSVHSGLKELMMAYRYLNATYANFNSRFVEYLNMSEV